MLLFSNEEKMVNECLIKQHITSFLTDGIVQVWVLGQVSYQTHCAPLQVDFVGL